MVLQSMSAGAGFECATGTNGQKVSLLGKMNSMNTINRADEASSIN